MAYKLFNFLGFQAGWFACVLGAAAGRPWLGPVVVAVLVAVNVALQRRRVAELLLVALAGALGYAVDSVLVLGGVLQFTPQAQAGWPSAAWMVALWMNLATTINASLGWLRGRYALAAVLGMIAGPLAYVAGARLGAITFGYPVWVTLLTVGGAWLVSMPALLGLDVLAQRAAARTAPGLTPSPEARP